MKKIGLLTINDYNNYGNRLQNYAAQEVLKSLGFYVETVVNTHYSALETNTTDRIKRILKKKPREVALKFWRTINRDKVKKYKKLRLQAFENFTASYILETDYTISKDSIPVELSNKYDYFVTGSDQVWNPTFRHFSSIDFLFFAPQNKRIAYAPSFGISAIPPEHIENYTIWISEMHRLSVREKAGAEIIKNLTGRESTILVDPTLMLTKDKWLNVSKPSESKPKKNYLLTYFLGEISKDNRNWLKEIAIENDLDIVNMADMKQWETYKAGPSEFIDYINSASLFCTDSFHGVVFSILMESPFIVFDRMGHMPSMNSRIDTLLSTFKLENRLSKNIQNNKQVFDVEYSHVAPILKNERIKALSYLKEALGINNIEQKEEVGVE